MEGIEIIRLKLGSLIGLILIVVLVFFMNSGFVWADSPGDSAKESVVPPNDDTAKTSTVKIENGEMTLEAVEINLANGTGQFEATGNVILTLKNNGLRMETGRLTYDSVTGIVQAPGLVKVIHGQAVLTINSLEYNLKNNAGSGGELQGIITGTEDGRDLNLTGKSIAIKNGVEVIEDTLVTRCPRPNPDYVFKARRVTVDDQRIRLANVVLYIKGIPVFYLPHLTLHTDRKEGDFPEIQLNYDNVKGAVFKEQSASVINKKLDFYTDIFIETQGKSNVGLGLGYQFTDSVSNRVFINNDLKGSWNIKDMVTFNTPGFLIVADGLIPLSPDNERQYGVSVTRKYWQGWGGSWQLGVLARSVAKLADPSDSGSEYGGTYAGYRLDYKPAANVTLSLLRLDNYAGTGDYRDYEVYTGFNLLYQWNVPLSTSFDLNLSGRYNFSGTDYLSNTLYAVPQYWIRQNYELVYNSCCWSINLGWDQVFKSWSLGATFKL
jgi:hypothetical protein